MRIAFVPEGGRSVAARESVLVDEATGAVEGEFLSDVEDGVGQAFLQGLFVILVDGFLPLEHLIIVYGLVELNYRISCEITIDLHLHLADALIQSDLH